MTKILEGMTIETLREAIQRGEIKPGQRFSVVFEDGSKQPGLAEIAARMRSTAAERGLTTEIFDSILAHNG